jgi:hypothetical protein
MNDLPAASTMRQRHADGDEAVESSSGATTFRRALVELDFFPKIEDDVATSVHHKQSPFFGGLTAVTSLILVYLFLSAFSVYLTTTSSESIVVDGHARQKLPVHFSLTFPHLACEETNIDLIDKVGEQVLHAVQGVRKQRIDLQGRKLGEPYVEKDGDDDGGGDHDTEHDGGKEEATRKSEHKTRASDEATMPPPSGTNNIDSGLTHAERLIEEARREAAQRTSGCIISGSLSVNRVGGNFHVTIGRTAMRGSTTHVHKFKFSRSRFFNASHTVNHLGFGDGYADRVDPLDGFQAAHASIAHYGYNIKVVPTTLIAANGVRTYSNQYSFTTTTKAVTRFDRSMNKHTIPGVFFTYSLSPFRVEIKQSQQSFTRFLTSLCAIVGGVYAVSHMLASTLHHVIPIISA